jgi:hypothetical protein
VQEGGDVSVSGSLAVVGFLFYFHALLSLSSLSSFAPFLFLTRPTEPHPSVPSARSSLLSAAGRGYLLLPVMLLFAPLSFSLLLPASRCRAIARARALLPLYFFSRPSIFGASPPLSTILSHSSPIRILIHALIHFSLSLPLSLHMIYNMTY